MYEVSPTGLKCAQKRDIKPLAYLGLINSTIDIHIRDRSLLRKQYWLTFGPTEVVTLHKANNKLPTAEWQIKCIFHFYSLAVPKTIKQFYDIVVLISEDWTERSKTV